jgi:hypothetical protein
MFYERLLRRTSLYKQYFKTEEGTELLKDLAEAFGAYKTSFVPGDSHQTAFNEGLRQAYSYIIGKVNGNEEIIRRAIQQENESAQLRSALMGEHNGSN